MKNVYIFFLIIKTNFFKIFSLINEFSKVEKFFSQYKFDFLITPGDRKEGLQISTCNIANKKKVPIIIFPTARYADSEVLKKSRNGYLINQKIIKLILFFFKEQVFIDQKSTKIYFYYSIYYSLILFLLKALPKRPWINGASNGDIICVDAEKTKQNLISHGIIEKKIKVTGFIEYQTLIERLDHKNKIRDFLINKYFINTKKQDIIVCALPQLKEHSLCTEKQHWNIIKNICTVLCSLPCNILVSLHPRVNFNEYEFLLKDFKIQISKEPLEFILPTASIFVSGNGSSTVLWSEIINIPTVVMDWYGLNYKIFNETDIRVIVKNEDDFKISLSKMLKITNLNKKRISKDYINEYENIEDVLLNNFEKLGK